MFFLHGSHTSSVDTRNNTNKATKRERKKGGDPDTTPGAARVFHALGKEQKGVLGLITLVRTPAELVVVQTEGMLHIVLFTATSAYGQSNTA